jgi:hypothetical protein
MPKTGSIACMIRFQALFYNASPHLGVWPLRAMTKFTTRPMAEYSRYSSLDVPLYVHQADSLPHRKGLLRAAAISCI